MVKVKICGLRRSEDIGYVNAYRPDYIGFVFAHSPRYVAPETAARLRKMLRPGIRAVGVFVNEDPELIESLCAAGVIDLVQLHGDEDAAYIGELRRRIDRPIIRAVRVRQMEQILAADRLPVDYLLLDTWVKGQYGGSGKSFDKRLIPALSKPYFLAGGLDAANVADNIRQCRPYAVDVSSAVETDGVKDREKIAEFIERVRAYE